LIIFEVTVILALFSQTANGPDLIKI